LFKVALENHLMLLRQLEDYLFLMVIYFSQVLISLM